MGEGQSAPEWAAEYSLVDTSVLLWGQSAESDAEFYGSILINSIEALFRFEY